MTESMGRIGKRAIIFAFVVTFLVAAISNGITAYQRAWYWAGFAVVIVTVEALGAVLFERFAHVRKWGYAGAAAVLWLFAVTASLQQTFASAARMQDSVASARLTQHASQTSAGDTRDIAAQRLAAAKAKLENLRKETWAELPKIDGQPITSAGAAQEAIAKAQAHRFWERTEQCGKTMGPDTRKFCNTYREATAAKAELERRAELKTQFDTAEKSEQGAHDAYLKAAGAATSAPLLTSQQDPFLRYASNSTGISAGTLEILAAAQLSITTQVILSILGVFLFGAASGLGDKPASDPGNSNWGGRPGNRTQAHAPAFSAPPAVLTAAPAPSIPRPAPVVRHVVEAPPPVSHDIIERVRNIRHLVTDTGRAVELKA